MKKNLGLTGAISIMSSALSSICYSSNANTIFTKENAILESPTISWDQVSANFTSMFNEFNINKKDLYQKYSSETIKQNNKNIDISDVIEYAKKEGQKIINNISKNTTSFDDLISYLKNNVKDFKRNYDNILSDSSKQKSKLIMLNSLQNPILRLKSIDNFSEQKANQLVEKIKLAKATAITVSATAAVAAAGFYAAAWWFGISIPWAIGCTKISAVFAGVSRAITIALLVYDKGMKKINKAISTFSAAYSLAHALSRTAIATLHTATISVTALTWCFPALIAAIAVLGSVIAWIDYNGL